MTSPSHKAALICQQALSFPALMHLLKSLFITVSLWEQLAYLSSLVILSSMHTTHLGTYPWSPLLSLNSLPWLPSPTKVCFQRIHSRHPSLEYTCTLPHFWQVPCFPHAILTALTWITLNCFSPYSTTPSWNTGYPVTSSFTHVFDCVQFGAYQWTVNSFRARSNLQIYFYSHNAEYHHAKNV